MATAAAAAVVAAGFLDFLEDLFFFLGASSARRATMSSGRVTSAVCESVGEVKRVRG